MRCLLKLAVAACVAVIANVLLQPGGVGDECAFAARVYVGQHFFGIAPDSPEMVDAAARLIERQGHMPAELIALRHGPVPMPDPEAEDFTAAATLPADLSRAAHFDCDELACAR
jgi:hypothetical protein